MIRRQHGPEPLVLHGARVQLRTLVDADFDQWHEVRRRCRDWLIRWEPRPAGAPYPAEDRPAFHSRCALRERERQMQTGFSFGTFVDGRLVGELTLSSILRGPFQSASIGYWIDEAVAGQGYTPEAVVVALRYAFEVLRLHRVGISIIPRNTPSLRVAEKLGLRLEGVTLGYLEIDGNWEDHARFSMTAEEWRDRCEELAARWL